MKLRRFPHLRAADGEMDPLELLQALPPGAAREFEGVLRRQHGADQTYVERQLPESALARGFEQVLDSRLARAVATGGGRRRR